MNGVTVTDAVEAWLGMYEWMKRPTKLVGSRDGYPHQTADDVLEDRGVTWAGDRWEYLAYECEIRRRARAHLGLEGAT